MIIFDQFKGTSLGHGILTDVTSPSRLLLAMGKETVLVQQAIEHAMSQARAHDPNTVRIDITASSENSFSQLATALSPSLFGETNVVVLSDIDQASDSLAEQLPAALSSIPDHIFLVITHPGGVKGKRLVDAIKKAGAREANCSELKGKDLEAAIIAEFKRNGCKVTPDAVIHLITAVGTGLGELMAAVSQLCADIEGTLIDGQSVSTYYAGISDVSGWQVSDAMWNAKPVEVLEKLRWAIESDDHAAIPLIVSITSGLRALLKYASAPAGMGENELAGLVGVPPWRIKQLRIQKQKWTPDQLERATRLLLLADRSSKGTMYSPGTPGGLSLDPLQSHYEIEKLLLAIRPPHQD